ncbi:armadillo-type protein [Mycena latifolia]|nr:armadillo-type protein [Mycena latifolia]
MDDDDVGFVFDFLTSIADSSEGADGVVAANTLPYLLEGLGSPSPDVREAAGCLTGALARHQSTAATVIAIKPCTQLVALYSRDDFEAKIAADALITIANWPDGAQAVVAAHVLDYVAEHLASQEPWVRRLACMLLQKLATHKLTTQAVMDLAPCEQLVIQLDTHDQLAFPALDALGCIAIWPNGAVAVVASKALDHLTNSLVSSWAIVRDSACRLLAALARHESTAPAVARAVPRERLVALLRDKDEDVRESAAKALRAIDDSLARVQAPTKEAGGPTINVL